MRGIYVIKRRLDPLTGAKRGRALVAISIGWLLFIGTQMIYPVLLTDLRAAYGIDFSVAGLLVTTLWLMQAVGQIPGGIVTDWIGGRSVLIASTLLGAVGLGLVATGGSVYLLFGATAVFGLAMAIFGIARFSVTNDLYPEHFGTSSGIIMAAADAGQTVLPPIATVIAAVGAWTSGFGFVIPLLLLSAGALWVTVPQDTVNRESEMTVTGSDSEPRPFVNRINALAGALWNQKIAYATVTFIIYTTVWASFTGFYPTYLVEVKGLSSTVAAMIFGTFFGLGVVFKPFAGSAYDQFGIQRALQLVVLVPCVAFALVPVAEGIVELLAVTAFAAPLLGSGAVVQPYIFEVLPEEFEGSGLATVRTIALGVGGVSPVVFGFIAGQGYFDEIYVVMAVLIALNGVVTILIPTR